MRYIRFIPIIPVVLFLYISGYMPLRAAFKETRDIDQKEYVIFPEGTDLLFYFYRLLEYIDAAFTGMRFHLGPHQ